MHSTLKTPPTANRLPGCRTDITDPKWGIGKHLAISKYKMMVLSLVHICAWELFETLSPAFNVSPAFFALKSALLAAIRRSRFLAFFRFYYRFYE